LKKRQQTKKQCQIRNQNYTPISFNQQRNDDDFSNEKLQMKLKKKLRKQLKKEKREEKREEKKFIKLQKQNEKLKSNFQNLNSATFRFEPRETVESKVQEQNNPVHQNQDQNIFEQIIQPEVKIQPEVIQKQEEKEVVSKEEQISIQEEKKEIFQPVVVEVEEEEEEEEEREKISLDFDRR